MKSVHRKPVLAVNAVLLLVVAILLLRRNQVTPDPAYRIAVDGTALDLGRKAVRVACVGDSITWGYALKDRVHDCYPAVLGRWLGPGYQVFNFGVPGASALDHSYVAYRYQPAFPSALLCAPNIVVILLGANDTKPGNWSGSAEFATDYGALVEQFRALSTKPRIFLCRPLPVRPGGFAGINQAGIEVELPQIDALAKREDAGEIDLYSLFAGRPGWLPDHVHPHAAGARLIAAAVYRAVTGKLPPL